MNKKNKELLSLVGIITIIVCATFFSFIFLDIDYRLLFNNDHIFQISQFYEEYANLLKKSIFSKTPIFYSWNTFLGTNYYASKVYYCIGNIFTPLLLLMRNNILDFMLLESILCVYISAISMFYYLKEMDIKTKEVYSTYAIIYAIGGCATMQFCYPMFHRFYAFLPLLFLGVEKYLKYNKLSLFSIVTGVLFLQNYYYMFSTSVFLPFYFIFSYYIKLNKGEFNIIKCLRKSLKLIVSYIIGLSMTAIIMLPGIIFILDNQRLAYNELNSLITWPLKTWLGIIYYLMLPVAQSATIVNPFEIPLYTDNTQIAYYYSIYNSVISIVGLMSVMLNNDKKLKSYKILLLFIFAIIMILPLNSIMMAFTTPSLRIMYLFSFVYILVSAKGMEEVYKNSYNGKSFIIIITIIYIFISIVCFATNIFNSTNIGFFFLSLGMYCLLFLYNFLVRKRSDMLWLLVILEVSTFSYLTISNQAFNNYDDNINKEYISYFKTIDDDILYRKYINYEEFSPVGASVLNQNVTLHYDFMSLYTYDSTYENSIAEFVEWTDSNITEHLFNISNPNLFKLLGVKYVGITDYETLDEINEYTYVYDLNHIHMYRLEDYNHLGHTFSKFITKDNFLKNKNPETFDWNDTLIVDEELYSIVKDYEKSNKNQMIVYDQINNNNFKATVECDSKEVLFISIPYDKGWTIKVDGIKTDIYNVDGGFIGIPLNEGLHDIEAWYMPRGFKLGAIISVFGCLCFLSLIYNDVHISMKKK